MTTRDFLDLSDEEQQALMVRQGDIGATPAKSSLSTPRRRRQEEHKTDTFSDSLAESGPDNDPFHPNLPRRPPRVPSSHGGDFPDGSDPSSPAGSDDEASESGESTDGERTSTGRSATSVARRHALTTKEHTQSMQMVSQFVKTFPNKLGTSNLDEWIRQLTIVSTRLAWPAAWLKPQGDSWN